MPYQHRGVWYNDDGTEMEMSSGTNSPFSTNEFEGITSLQDPNQSIFSNPNLGMNNSPINSLSPKNGLPTLVMSNNNLNNYFTPEKLSEIGNDMEVSSQLLTQSLQGEKPITNSNTINPFSIDFGRAYSLDSALFGLGNAMSKKDYSGMSDEQIQSSKNNDLLLGVGSAGKALIGGARTFFSGKGYGQMNNWVQMEDARKKRQQMVNNQQGVSNAYAPNSFQEGGLVGDSEDGNLMFDDGFNIPNTNNVSNLPLGSFEENGKRFVRWDDGSVMEVKTPEQFNNVDKPIVEKQIPIKKSYDDYSSFNSAYGQAKKDLGQGSEFTYKGKRYLISDRNNSNTKTNPIKNSKVSTNKDDSQLDFSKYSNYELGAAYQSLNKEGRQDAASYIVNELKNRNIIEDGKGSFKSSIVENKKNNQKPKEKSRFDYNFDSTSGNEGVPLKRDPISEGVLSTLTLGASKLIPGIAKIVESGGKDGKMDTFIGAVDTLPFTGKLFSSMLSNTSKALAKGSDVNIATKIKLAEDLVKLSKNSKTAATAKQTEVINQAERFLKGVTPVQKRTNNLLPNFYGFGKSVQSLDAVDKYQEGGQVEQPQVNPEEILQQVEMAVQNGEMTPEEAQQVVQELQMMQGGNPEQAQQQEQPQISPEQAQAQLAQAVENGEISPEEATTYLEQLYGQTPTNSNPTQPYTGQVREKIAPEAYLTGEYITGDDDKPHNTEVEKGEYVTQTSEDGTPRTQQVVGERHHNGGEKMNLAAGTIVITDKDRIGATYAKVLSNELGLKLNAGDTFSRVLDIFNKKIGLDDLNKEQEELFSTLRKVDGKGGEKTQELNNNFLNAKISDIENKKQTLLSQREQLVEVLFEMQEEAKSKKENKKSDKNDEGLIYAQSGTEITNPCEGLTGLALAECIVQSYNEPTPTYEYGDTQGQGKALVPFLKNWNVDTPEGIDAMSQTQQNELARQAQSSTDDAVASHYGTYTAPTRSGLQWLVDNGYVEKNNPAIKGIINKDGKILRGSYDTLDENGKKVISEVVDGIYEKDKNALNNYAQANYRDGEWFFRNPSYDEITLNSDEELEKAKSSYKDIGNGFHYSGKQGKYLKFKVNPTTGEVEPTKEATKETPKIDIPKTKKRANNFLFPDQSTLPPEALRAVPANSVRYNYLDKMEVSPEQGLLENYRNYATTKASMEGLPDTTSQINQAMLAGNIAQANNQLIGQTNATNAQLASQIDATNNGILRQQAEIDLRLADQYATRMDQAVSTTRKDLEGFYDFNRRINVGEFNDRNSLAILNNLYSTYGLNPDGTPVLDPTTQMKFYIDNMSQIQAQQYQDMLDKKQAKVVTKVDSSEKPSSGWNKGKKQ